jgi:hypothetical protein
MSDPQIPPENRFELVFEASGVVGQGTAVADSDDDQDGDRE